MTALLMGTVIALSILALSATASPGPVYSPAHLPRIVDPKPRIAGWSFERTDSYIYPVPAHDPAFTLKEWLLANSPNKKDRAMAAALAKAGFVIGRHLVWEGSHGGPGAGFVVFTHLYRNPAGAQRAERLLFRPGAPRARGLGSDAWENSDGKTGANVWWRRGNLLVVVAIDCDDSDCGFPPLPPTRAWAAQIDRRARLTR